MRGMRPASGTESGPHVAREGYWGTSLCLASLVSIGYQRFVELNWSFMRRLVRACVNALKNAQIIPSAAKPEKMVGSNRATCPLHNNGGSDEVRITLDP